jgi:hypothetical protein
MSTPLVLLLLFLGVSLATAVVLWLGAKWAKIPQVSLVRAFSATLMIGLLSLQLHLGFMWLWSFIPSMLWSTIDLLVAFGIELGAVLLVTWLALMLVFRTSLWRAIVSWLPTLVLGAAAFALIQLALKPYILAAFVLPANSMAPTLLGPHRRGVYPHCGQTATCQAADWSDASQLGMCESCQQAGMVANVGWKVYAPDRFVVNKLLTPRRWDLVVFQSLEDPSKYYVKRLIGFPGEEVVIKDGKIWINGTQ